MPTTDTNEAERLRALFAYESRLYAEGAQVVVGIDEVGRGALAGPVTAGAVVLGSGWKPEMVAGLNESKQLTRKRRETVAEHLRECVHSWSVAHIEPAVIDERGIMDALRQAMEQALAGLRLDSAPDAVLIDGRPLRLFAREVAIVKGDAQIAAIAAASVLAKVERDALMREAEERFPGYGFASNVGYGSSTHCAALAEKGLSAFHRRTFCSRFIQETLF